MDLDCKTNMDICWGYKYWASDFDTPATYFMNIPHVEVRNQSLPLQMGRKNLKGSGLANREAQEEGLYTIAPESSDISWYMRILEE